MAHQENMVRSAGAQLKIPGAFFLAAREHFQKQFLGAIL